VSPFESIRCYCRRRGLFDGFFGAGASNVLVCRGDRGESTGMSSIERRPDSKLVPYSGHTYDKARSSTQATPQALSNRYSLYTDFASYSQSFSSTVPSKHRPPISPETSRFIPLIFC